MKNPHAPTYPASLEQAKVFASFFKKKRFLFVLF